MTPKAIVNIVVTHQSDLVAIVKQSSNSDMLRNRGNWHYS